jgi:hypothetical protein
MDSLKKLKISLDNLLNNQIIFWFSLIILNLLLFLPQTILSPSPVSWFPLTPLSAPRGWYDVIFHFVRRENQDFVRLVAEYYLIVTILFLSIKLNWSAWIRRILIGVYIFLLIYQIYHNTMVLLFGEAPILYNDLLLLKGAFYLVIDISLTKKLFEIFFVFMVLGILLLSIPFLFHALQNGFRKWLNSRIFLITGLSLWLIIIVNNLWFKFSDYRTTIHWITPKITNNVQKSYRLRKFLHAIPDVPKDSTYYLYKNIHLEFRPDIYIFMVESYGRVLLDHPDSRQLYLPLIKEVADTLRSRGWHAQSIFSEAPIFGGRSWLTMGSMITGVRIKDEAVYSYFINRTQQYPHLIQFFNQQGYHTVALQPLNRVRPGFSMTSYERFYKYQTFVNFEDLDFDGPAFGFRNIPDQFSLNYAYEKYLKKVEKPKFLFFLTVSSHSPWLDLPPYVENWRDIKTTSQDQLREKYGKTSEKIRETFKLNISSGTGIAEYLNHMIYEIKIIRDFILNEIHPNSIVIILGDHQPPIITKENSSFATPLHFISGDQELLHSLQQYGFSPGLQLDPSQQKGMHHEALYSLLIRVLAQNYSSLENLPKYLPSGNSISIIKD